MFVQLIAAYVVYTTGVNLELSNHLSLYYFKSEKYAQHVNGRPIIMRSTTFKYFTETVNQICGVLKKSVNIGDLKQKIW